MPVCACLCRELSTICAHCNSTPVPAFSASFTWPIMVFKGSGRRAVVLRVAYAFMHAMLLTAHSDVWCPMVWLATGTKEPGSEARANKLVIITGRACAS